MAVERWLPVPGYDGVYQVSDLGRVRSCYRYVNCGTGLAPRRGRILRPSTEGSGYRKVSLRLNGKQRSWTVHRLVLVAFVGPPPTNPAQGAHLNGRRGDNRLINLAWVTPQQNTDQKQWHLPASARLVNLRAAAMATLSRAGFSDFEIARCFRASIATVKRARLRSTTAEGVPRISPTRRQRRAAKARELAGNSEVA
jgi:hypothetical protein